MPGHKVAGTLDASPRSLPSWAEHRSPSRPSPAPRRRAPRSAGSARTASSGSSVPRPMQSRRCRSSGSARAARSSAGPPAQRLTPRAHLPSAHRAARSQSQKPCPQERAADAYDRMLADKARCRMVATTGRRVMARRTGVTHAGAMSWANQNGVVVRTLLAGRDFPRVIQSLGATSASSSDRSRRPSPSSTMASLAVSGTSIRATLP